MLFEKNGVEESLCNNFVQAEEEPAWWCEKEAGRLETRVEDSNQTLSSIQYCHVTQGVMSVTGLYVTILFC